MNDNLQKRYGLPIAICMVVGTVIGSGVFFKAQTVLEKWLKDFGKDAVKAISGVELSLLKDMGFNMVRKHIKIEPLRWYYHCDRLGLIVWQDFVNGGGAYKFTHIAAFPFLGFHHKVLHRQLCAGDVLG